MGHKPRAHGAGVKLAEVMAAAMTDGETREMFDAAVAAEGSRARAESRAARERHLELFGWLPPAEIDELAAAIPGYWKCFNEISDVWMIRGVFGAAKDLPADFGALWDGFEGSMWAMCGVVRCGDDPSGDTAWCSTLPSADDSAVIYRYDHEVGRLDSVEGCSIGNFVIDTWAGRYDPEARERIDPRALARYQKLEARFKKTRLPDWKNPMKLFARSCWLLSFGAGSTAYGFARDLCKAAPMTAWWPERELLDEAPWLANYWLLAHFFLDNRKAAAEAVDRAASSPSELTRQLAWAVDRALADESSSLFGVSAAQIAELKAACAKNAIPELLERNTTAADASGPDIGAIKAELAGGADPWAVIARHPDSVAAHDAALEHLQKSGDKKDADLVKGYFGARSRSPYNEWPWDPDDLDRRISTVVAAAFRTGLAFDADHDRAYSGITKTLAMLDDDAAMDAFAAAIEALGVDDDRLEYVVDGLAASRHPRAGEIMHRAAWRTFELLEEARANEARLEAERERDGVTLDNMFGTGNHLLAAMRHVLDAGGDRAVALADKILTEKKSYKLFRLRFGDAFRIAGDAGLDQHRDTVFGFIDAVGGIQPRDEESFLDPTILINFGEACLAAAKLDRERAAPIARALFERQTAAPMLDLDVKGATLGARLLCEGATGELVGWVERLLGNRTNAARVAPVLRGVADAGLEVARPWVRYHVYSKKNHLMLKDRVIALVAPRTAARLGDTDLPELDEDTKFANRVPDGELAAGFDKPEKYWPGHLCKRIVEHKVTDDATFAAVVAFATDAVRFSADNGWRESGDEDEALKALGIMGERALAPMAAMLELPHLDPGMRTLILLAMRFAVPEAPRWIEAARMPIDRVLAGLESPPPRWMAMLDLLAARARVDGGDRAAAAIEAATRWRYERTGSVFDDNDPALQHLPMAWATCEGGAAGIEALQRQQSHNYHVEESLAAALERTKKGAGPGAAPALPAKLVSKRPGHGWKCTLEVTDAAVTTEVDEVYCKYLDDDDKKSTAQHGDPAVGATIAKMAAALGYR